MHRRHLAISLFALFVLPATALSQAIELPTPEEYAERAERAERAPLFQSHEVLKMTLRTDIKWLLDERNDSIEVEGTLTFIDLDGSEVVRPVDTRARGIFRRQKANCNFPPLRLDFPRSQMDGTVFEDQNQLKLVTPCHDGRDQYQNYVFDEYLAYRLLNIFAPECFRVRLVEITYEDIEGEEDTRTKFGFLIESDEALAERNRATHQEVSQFHPGRAYGPYSVHVAMFNYMIANTDWSPVYFHNVELIRTEDGRYLTVPYDFDVTGIVNPRYASVDPRVPINRVTQRIYRGFCREELTYETATAPFRGKQDEVQALYEGFAALGFEQFDADDAKDTLEFLENFWKVIDDPGEFEDEILDDCRSMVTG